MRLIRATFGAIVGAALAIAALLLGLFLLQFLLELVFGPFSRRGPASPKAGLLVLLAPIIGAILGGNYAWRNDAQTAKKQIADFFGSIPARLRLRLPATPLHRRPWSASPMTTFRETYPGPWTIVEHDEAIAVECRGTVLAYIYVEDREPRRTELRRVSRAEARALAKAIAGLAEPHVWVRNQP